MRAGAGILHSSLQRQMEELTAAGVLHEADFNERVLDALHCLPLANAQVLGWRWCRRVVPSVCIEACWMSLLHCSRHTAHICRLSPRPYASRGSDPGRCNFARCMDHHGRQLCPLHASGFLTRDIVPSLQRALAHLAQAVSSIQIEEVRSVPAYIMSIIAKHQPGREVRLRSDSGGTSLVAAESAVL